MCDASVKPIPGFDAHAGIHLSQVENGGWIVRQAPGSPMCEASIIAAYSSSTDLFRALDFMWGPLPPST
jgi:hypothetical protein